jgi:hypothetical protein
LIEGGVMNFNDDVIGTVINLDGEVFIERNGIEVPLREEMTLLSGDIIRSTQNSLAVINIPGTQQQIPVYVEVSNGSALGLSFDPTQGQNGRVVINKMGDDVGNLVLISEFEGENHAAVMDGQEPSDTSMVGLFGAGIAGGGLIAPVAGVVGATALFSGLSDDDDTTTVGPGSGGSGLGDSGVGGDTGGDGIPSTPAETAGGLSETVTDLTDNLSEVTAPIPVVSDVVDAVGQTLDSVLVGDNNGGLGGILTGLGDGLAGGLDGTPLEPVGNVLDTLLGTIGGGLGLVADQVSSFGDNTPLEPLADLLGDILGRSGENTDSGVGGVVGTLTNVTDGLAQLLQPVPLLGELTGTLDTVVDSIAFGNNDGGLAGILSGLGGGLQEGLASTPLALVGEGGNTLLNTVGGLLGGVGDLVTSLGANTPVAPVTDLVGDLAGSLGGDVSSALANIPFLGGALDELISGLGGGGSLLGDIPLLGDLLDGGDGGGLLAGIPVVGDLLGGLTSSISSTGGAEGGLLSGLPLLGDLTRGLS